MNLPGYDAWKLEGPPEMTPEEEREMEERDHQQKQDLRDAIAAALLDNRADIYLSDIRQIVIEELNKLQRQAGEPEWQTRTPVPLKFDEQAFALREAYVVLAFYFNRLHGSARSRDGELCQSIGIVRGKIERAIGIPALSGRSIP